MENLKQTPEHRQQSTRPMAGKSSSTEPRWLIVGADTGGTFTDLIAIVMHDEEQPPLTVAHKVLSTPDDPGRAVLQGLHELLIRLGITEYRRILLVHGSTVATNALLERRGVPTAFITTAGFEDLLHIGRQHRAELYNLQPQPKAPLIPAARCFGVAERMDASGNPLVALTRAEAERIASAVAASGVESAAVCLLFSFRNPAHEIMLTAALEERGIHVSPSHRVLPEHREYERASTTAINAYVSPLMQRYLRRLEQNVAAQGVKHLRIMQSNGGSISAAQAGSEAVHTVLSGPAGGVVGAQAAAMRAGFSRVITFDMGGTSTDVCLVPGQVQVTTEGEIDGLPVRVPILPIHTVGAGGGSIAYLDAGGALRVGPRSAGANPGPACYGLGGTQPTVTDAHVVLNRLPAEGFLGGRLRLDVAAARRAVGRLGDTLGADIDETAWGIIQVANIQMERALRVISIEKGYDPSDFALISFGGAGGLHACDLAGNLGIPQVIVPAHPGVLSAWGMAVADIVKTYSQGLPGLLRSAVLDQAQSVLQALLNRAVEDLATESGSGNAFADMHSRRTMFFAPALDLRYVGQSFEITVPLPQMQSNDANRPPQQPQLDADRLLDAFHQAHERLYGHRFTDPVELVAVRLRAWLPGVAHLLPKAKAAECSAAEKTAPLPACLRTVHAYIGTGRTKTPVWAREQLAPGMTLVGPAIIVEDHATTVVRDGDRVNVDSNRNLIITLNRAL